jgi:hypothetical protein
MLVLDANILIRAVLGSRVLSLLRKYADRMEFLAPDTAFQEAREHLPRILERRNVPLAPAFAILELVATYRPQKLKPTHEFESVARELMQKRKMPHLTGPNRIPEMQPRREKPEYGRFSNRFLSHPETTKGFKINARSKGIVSGASQSVSLHC